MFLKLRIVFTILSAVCLAVIIPATVHFKLLGFGICGLGALFFFALMLVCKQEQERREEKEKKDTLPLAPTESEKNADEKTE